MRIVFISLVLTMICGSTAAQDVLSVAAGKGLLLAAYPVCEAIIEPGDFLGCTEARMYSHASSSRVSVVSVAPEGLPFWRSDDFVEGIGYAYLQDPLGGEPHEVVLPRLYGDGTRLDGLYVRVRSDRLDPEGEQTQSLNGTDARYLPNTAEEQDCIRNIADCSPFDAVNVYYHIDHFAQTYWVERMGVVVSFQVNAVTHINGDGAFADGDRQRIMFGLGEIFMKNAAKEDDLIYHEYTHLITSSLGYHVGAGSSLEAKALNEGYADYFTASFTDDPHIGEWVITCPARQHCTGPPNDRELRTLVTDPLEWNWNDGNPSDALKYGVCTRYHEGDQKCKTSHNNFAPQYVWGIIWAGALWDLRTALGADITDRLVLEGLLLNHETTLTFDAARDALIEADRQQYGGVHTDRIATLLNQRGILGRVPVNVEQNSPEMPALMVYPSYPNPFRATARIRFSLSEAGPVSLAVYDLLGREVDRKEAAWYPAGQHRLDWDAREVSNGAYVAVLTAGTIRQTLRLVRAR